MSNFRQFFSNYLHFAMHLHGFFWIAFCFQDVQSSVMIQLPFFCAHVCRRARCSKFGPCSTYCRIRQQTANRQPFWCKYNRDHHRKHVVPCFCRLWICESKLWQTFQVRQPTEFRSYRFNKCYNVFWGWSACKYPDNVNVHCWPWFQFDLTVVFCSLQFVDHPHV